MGGGDLLRELAGGVDLGTEGDGAEAMAEGVEGSVVRCQTGGGEVGADGGLEEPPAAVVVFLIAGEEGERVFEEPLQVVGEPGADGCKFVWGEGGRGRQEGDRFGNLC